MRVARSGWAAAADAPGHGRARPPARTILALGACVLAVGCGETGGTGGERRAAPLPTGVRPIGAGPRFTPPVADRPVPDCRPGPLGERVGVHLELFGADRVVLFPAGIGTEPPRRRFAGRIAGARCFGPLVTIDPTGLVLLRPGHEATVGDVFALWGQPLAPRRAAGFRGRVRAYVNGRRVDGHPGAIPLRRHDQIVLQVGAYVPPHADYAFPEPY